MRLGRRGRRLGQRLQRAAAAGLHLGGAAGHPGEELDHLLLHLPLARASASRAAYSATKAARFASSALSRRSLGRL
jgi:hypothetical protein